MKVIENPLKKTEQSNNKPKVIVVIPALNEEKTIEEVISSVSGYVSEVIVVNDGSKDGTPSIANACGAIVLSHNQREGYERSVDDGFALACKRGGDIVLTFDADGQHNAEDIPKVIGPIIKNETDIVVGIRPDYPRIAEKLYSRITKKRIGVTDPLCGLKAYKTEVYRKIGYFDRNFTVGVSFLFNAYENNFRILEQPITINKREDHSRFGGKVKANWKIFCSMVSVITA